MNIEQAIEYLASHDIKIASHFESYIGNGTIVEGRRTPFSIEKKSGKWHLHAIYQGQLSHREDFDSLKDAADRLISFKPQIKRDIEKAKKRKRRLLAKYS